MSLHCRLRFGLKTMIVAVTLLCIVLALVAQPVLEARRQKQLLGHVAALGGRFSIRGFVPRRSTPGRFLLAMFDSSYAHNWYYGLDFSGTRLKDDDLKLIGLLEHVQELNARGAQISDEGLRYLVDMKHLRRLDLGGTKITDQGLMRLRPLRKLASLNVIDTPSTYEVLEQLDQELPYAHFCEERAIDELKAAGVQVTDLPRLSNYDSSDGAGMMYVGHEAVLVVVGMNRPATLSSADVSRLSHLKSLRTMTLHTVSLGPEGITALEPLPALKDLDIWSTNLTDSDLAAIARHENLERLTIYDADEISDTGVAQLKALTKLKHFRVSACIGVTQDGFATVERALPSCHCEFSPY